MKQLGPITLLDAVGANGNSAVVDVTLDGWTRFGFHRSGAGDGTVTIYGTMDKNPATVAGSVWVSLGTVASGALLQYSGTLTGFYAALTGWGSGAVTVKATAARGD